MGNCTNRHKLTKDNKQDTNERTTNTQRKTLNHENKNSVVKKINVKD